MSRSSLNTVICSLFLLCLFLLPLPMRFRSLSLPLLHSYFFLLLSFHPSSSNRRNCLFLIIFRSKFESVFPCLEITLFPNYNICSRSHKYCLDVSIIFQRARVNYFLATSPGRRNNARKNNSRSNATEKIRVLGIQKHWLNNFSFLLGLIWSFIFKCIQFQVLQKLRRRFSSIFVQKYSWLGRKVFFGRGGENLMNIHILSKYESVKIYWLSMKFDWFK